MQRNSNKVNSSSISVPAPKQLSNPSAKDLKTTRVDVTNSDGTETTLSGMPAKLVKKSASEKGNSIHIGNGKFNLPDDNVTFSVVKDIVSHIRDKDDSTYDVEYGTSALSAEDNEMKNTTLEKMYDELEKMNETKVDANDKNSFDLMKVKDWTVKRPESRRKRLREELLPKESKTPRLVKTVEIPDPLEGYVGSAADTRVKRPHTEFGGIAPTTHRPVYDVDPYDLDVQALRKKEKRLPCSISWHT